MPDSILSHPLPPLPVIAEWGILANWGSASIMAPVYCLTLWIRRSPLCHWYSSEPLIGLWVHQARGRSPERCVRTPPPLPSPGSHRALKTCRGPNTPTRSNPPVNPFLSLGHQAKPALWGECRDVMRWVLLHLYPDPQPPKAAKCKELFIQTAIWLYWNAAAESRENSLYRG